MLCTTRFVAAAAVVCVLVSPLPAAEPIEVTSVSMVHTTVVDVGAGAFGRSGACLLSAGDRPVACFGLYKRPRQPTRYTYFMLFKTDPQLRAGGTGLRGEGKSDLFQADLKITVFSGEERQFEYGYRYHADEIKELVSETLRVGDKEFKNGELKNGELKNGELKNGELKNGDARVFLIDLAPETPTCRSVEVELPTEVPELTDFDHRAWGAAVEKTIARLAEQSEEVRAFVGR